MPDGDWVGTESDCTRELPASQAGYFDGPFGAVECKSWASSSLRPSVSFPGAREPVPLPVAVLLGVSVSSAGYPRAHPGQS